MREIFVHCGGAVVYNELGGHSQSHIKTFPLYGYHRHHMWAIEEENKAENDDKKEESEAEIEEIEDENEMRRDLQNDIIGAKYLQVEKSVYFMDYEIFSLEVPVKEHGKPEIVEAKNNEIENLKTYETFEEVMDEGQETIGSRWIITEKTET